ncbi:GreA/GreB family elongation factor [Candidatus Parcubacteria bacterium]|nr:GreA/GreB family elongation factor [Candidatus Parcubacteria bacterium]
MSNIKNFYLTKKGLEKIEKEYTELKYFQLSKNREESPEFLVKTRMENLENILRNAELIKLPAKRKQDIINLGAEVVLEKPGKQTNKFLIIGSLETNPEQGKISFESPIGQALLGRKVGDKITISSPVKTIYKVKKINYQHL